MKSTDGRTIHQLMLSSKREDAMPALTIKTPQVTQVIKQRQTENLIVGEVSHPPLFTAPLHEHEEGYIGFVLQGTYTEKAGDRLVEGGAHSVAFHPEGEKHWFKIHEQGLKCLIVQLEPGWLAQLGKHREPLDNGAFFSGGRMFQLAARVYNELHQPDDAASLAMEGLVLEMFAEASRRTKHYNYSHQPRWLSQIHDLLHDRFIEAPSLEELGKVAGVHPVHVARAFRGHYQSTVGEYIRQLRVEHACKQIAGTDAPLVDIALESGFTDQSHFSRTFKQIIGMTPAKYRANVSRY
jgi:AraC family transcriptional regulator